MSVMDAIRERKLRSARASVTFQETRDKLLHDKAEATKAVLGKTNSVVDEGIMQMSQLYYRMHDEYYAKSSIRMPHSFTKRSMSLWSRVVKACKQAEVPPETYMRAQFAFFHKAFGRPPELFQLSTENAKQRAREFAKVPTITKKVVGNDIRHKVDIADTMRAAESQMQKVCRAQSMTREEVYEKLVLTGLMTFPQEYLKADPVFSKVKDKVGR